MRGLFLCVCDWGRMQMTLLYVLMKSCMRVWIDTFVACGEFVF